MYVSMSGTTAAKKTEVQISQNFLHIIADSTAPSSYNDNAICYVLIHFRFCGCCHIFTNGTYKTDMVVYHQLPHSSTMLYQVGGGGVCYPWILCVFQSSISTFIIDRVAGGDNTFGSVRVCASVRLSVGALLFEPFDLDFRHDLG